MKVVVTDITFNDYEEEKKVFDAIGCELIIKDCKTEDEIIEVAKDADGLLNAAAQVTRRVIESLPNLKAVSRYGIGVDTIDTEAASERGVYVGNVPDYCHAEVSDHALALILSFARKIVVLNYNTKTKHTWSVFDEAPIRRFSTQTVGLVSFGNIARSLCKKLQAIGFKVIASDPYCSQELAREYDVELVSMEELMKRSDIVSVHAPLTKETHHFINEELINLMKKDAFIVNTGRGPVIDEKALVNALKEKKIAGAALDVIEVEPIDPNNPLIQMDNVILTPHAAFYSEESCNEMKRKAAQNIADVLLGKEPKYWVNNKEFVK
ncbi:C-terminal binding protein [Alkalihalobacillus sp. BA299]|uniref:C-terminal binding protein n=1 Tax=Alkalihalobacillus sp. BA299 TaxID=2815938 RepID=UPI001ADBA8F4|nr:C-terminal binding protein [Alkalihalobacillus sp. BA299]